MARWFDITLVCLGSFLLLFRLVIRIQAIRKGVEVSVMIAAGAALSLFAPLTPLPDPYSVPIMLALGVMLSSPLCGKATFAFSMLIIVETLGVALFSVLWHLGLCGASGDAAGWVHPILMTIVVLLCVCATALKASGQAFEAVFCPMLGSLLATLGAAGLSPEMQGLTATGLFAPEPCVDYTRTSRDLGAWCALFLVGALLSQLLRKTSEQQRQDGAGNDMAKSFIDKHKEGQGDAEGGAGMNKKELDNNMGRHNVLTQAIYADEGADQSHLTEHERGLVNICRSDDFERDRFLWGGGLW